MNLDNTIKLGDSVKLLRAMAEETVDLAFADPPFNIGFDYDAYDDKKDSATYLNWSRTWISEVYRVLKSTGTFWLAIGDEYAAELKLLSQEIGFHTRSWVVWYYTFGVNCKYKFTRSHAHLFYFVKNPKEFTFLSDDPENRIPSARQLVYGDSRANPVGRLPDDTWVLRPQDAPGCLSASEDTWYFPRVAGTFKERAGFHGCQMPEQLLGRIIRACSRPDDLVLDPFSGSATTAAVAKKLGRKYLAFDISKNYIQQGRRRLKEICVGDPLDGAVEPTLSAPATHQAAKRSTRVAAAHAVVASNAPQSEALTPTQLRLYQQGLISAYQKTYRGYSLDRLLADPEMNQKFVDVCLKQHLPGDARSWNWALLGLRKAGLLSDCPTTKRTELSWEASAPFLHACEIAWGELQRTYGGSLDGLFCDPELAAQFDQKVQQWAPGHSPLEYRWGAIKLRKHARTIRSRAKLLQHVPLKRAQRITIKDVPAASEAPGAYLVVDADDTPLYAGASLQLRATVQLMAGPAKPRRSKAASPHSLWQAAGAEAVYLFEAHTSMLNCLAYQFRWAEEHRPQLNAL